MKKSRIFFLGKICFIVVFFSIACLLSSNTVLGQCSQLDILIIFDRSASTSPAELNNQKSNAIDIINTRQLSQTFTKIGVISYGAIGTTIYDGAEINHLLTSDKNSLINTITNLPNPVGNGCVACAFFYAHSIFGSGSTRLTSQKLVLLFTDGNQTAFVEQTATYKNILENNYDAVIVAFAGDSIVEITGMDTLRTIVPGLQTLFPDQHDVASFINVLNTNYPDFINSTVPLISSSDENPCEGSLYTLSIDTGSLNDAGYWQWYSDSCNGTPIGTGSSINVTASLQNGYYVRGEGVCVSNAPCGVKYVDVQQQVPWFMDSDSDGFGNTNQSIFSCAQPQGYAGNELDCNDSDSLVNPLNPEVCNGSDDDCDVQVDEHVSANWLLYMPFSGNTNDYSGNANHGTAQNVEYWRDFQETPMDALRCNRDSAMVFLPITSFLLNNYTYSARFRLSTTIPNARVYSLLAVGGSTQYQQLLIANDPANGNVGVGFKSYGTNGILSSCFSGFVPAINEWHHVAVTRDNSVLKVFLNGTLVCSSSTIAPAGYAGSPLFATIGAMQNPNNLRFPGYIDEVMIHDNALPDTEIDTLKNNIGMGIIAVEVCNNLDDDCDGLVDEELLVTFYQDLDNDGFGNINYDSIACLAPAGFVTNGSDCNDSDSSMHQLFPFYADNDYDTYGAGSLQNACASNSSIAPAGYSLNNNDCNDLPGIGENVHPGGNEVCGNSLDDDCNGITDSYLPSGLKLYMPLNGNTIDESGNNHHGTLYNATLTSDRSGNPNSAYQFNGTNTRIEIPDHADFHPTNLSISAWIKLDGLNGAYQAILNKSVGTSVYNSYVSAYENSTGRVGVFLCNTSSCATVFTSQSNPSGWFHYAITFNDAANELKVYINGLLRQTTVTTHSLFYDSSPLTIGCEYENNALTYFLKGKLDDVMFFDRALSASEIAQLSATDIPNEVCNGLDENCNGLVDEGLLYTYFADIDNDLYGNANDTIIICDVVAPAGYVSDSSDCNDTDSFIRPWVVDACNGIDDNCNGLIDENCIKRVQYYFDTDPGAGVAGNGGFINSTSISSEEHITASIPTTGLAQGFHTLYIRIQSASGAWGLARSYPFVISPAVHDTGHAVVQAEYFFDTDPGVRSAIQLPTGVAALATVNFQSAIPTTGLSNGFHMLYLRLKDTNQNWGLWRSYPFVLTQPYENTTALTGGEVFFDTDPGVGNGIAIWQPFTPANTVNLIRNVFVPNTQANGYHNLYIRFKDASGKWGLSQRAQYAVAGSTCQHISLITPTDSVLLCSTDSMLLTENSMGSFTWQWKKDGIIIPGATSRSYYAQGGGIYTCTIVSAFCTFSSDTLTIYDAPLSTWFLDVDGDNYGITTNSIVSCIEPPGYAIDSADCNDADPMIHPVAIEVCDGIDDDCDMVSDDSCVFTLNLQAYIEGLYTGAQAMKPALYNSGINASTSISDSIIVELHEASSPSNVVLRKETTFKVNGHALIYIPTSLNGTTVYIVIRHRNSIETWSKLPVTISNDNFYDFRY